MLKSSCGLFVALMSAAGIVVMQPQITVAQSAPDVGKVADGQIPIQLRVWLSRGQVLFRLRRYSEALTAAEKALEISPNDVFALELQGNALHKLGLYEEALTVYNKALKLLENQAQDTFINTSLWAGRARVLESVNRDEEARTSYKSAIQLQCISRARIESSLYMLCSEYLRRDPVERNISPKVQPLVVPSGVSQPTSQPINSVIPDSLW